MNKQVVINPSIDTKLDENIRKDDRDEIRGYDVGNFASYNVSK